MSLRNSSKLTSNLTSGKFNANSAFRENTASEQGSSSTSGTVTVSSPHSLAVNISSTARERDSPGRATSYSTPGSSSQIAMQRHSPSPSLSPLKRKRSNSSLEERPLPFSKRQAMSPEYQPQPSTPTLPKVSGRTIRESVHVEDSMPAVGTPLDAQAGAAAVGAEGPSTLGMEPDAFKPQYLGEDRDAFLETGHDAYSSVYERMYEAALNARGEVDAGAQNLEFGDSGGTDADADADADADTGDDADADADADGDAVVAYAGANETTGQIPAVNTDTDADADYLRRYPSPVATEIVETYEEPTSEERIAALKDLGIKVHDFAYEPVSKKLRAPEVWRNPLHSLAIHDTYIRVAPDQRPTYQLPGKLLRRLLDLNWVTREEANRYWTLEDWKNLEQYDALPNGPYPYRLAPPSRKPSSAYRRFLRKSVYPPQATDRLEEEIYVPPDEPDMDEGPGNDVLEAHEAKMQELHEGPTRPNSPRPPISDHVNWAPMPADLPHERVTPPDLPIEPVTPPASLPPPPPSKGGLARHKTMRIIR
ncbi:hypothetical protein BKA93DRAFT_748257 [Sparassis latifolia]